MVGGYFFFTIFCKNLDYFDLFLLCIAGGLCLFLVLDERTRTRWVVLVPARDRALRLVDALLSGDAVPCVVRA